MVDRTTVVTAFYPLARSKHGVARYHTWIQNFCRLNCQLVVYTDDSQKNMFATLCPKAMVVARPFDSWQMTSPAMMDFWRRQTPRDPERTIHSPELYAVWAIKQECIMETIRTNPYGSDWFVWCDVGILREPAHLDWYAQFPQKVPDLCLPGRIGMLEVALIPDRFVEAWRTMTAVCPLPLPAVTVGGGCIAGDKVAWQDFSEAYVKMLQLFDERGWFAGKDQLIYFAMLIERAVASPFRLFAASGPVDPWMSFPAILSGSIRARVDRRFN